jgi:glycosyltransferase involved in cell wall biosynthesis
MEENPYFTIVSPDYHGAISDFRRNSFLHSVVGQSFPNWELLLIHDGPRPTALQNTIKDDRIHFLETTTRYNDWGHTLRDIGIKKARGKYIWIMNADNIAYPHTLAILHAYSLHKERHQDFKFKGGEIIRRKENPKVLVFGVKMMGAMHVHNGAAARLRGRELEQQYLLPGWPPQKFRIDAMSCVVDKEIWMEKGWYQKHEESDGDLISEICEKHGYTLIPEILGEHW